MCVISTYIQHCTPFCRKKVKHRADVNRAVRVLSYRPSLEGNRYQNDIPGAERGVSPPGSDGYSTALEGRPVDLTTVDYIDAAEGRPASVSVAGYVSASEVRPRTNVIVADNDQYEGPESTGEHAIPSSAGSDDRNSEVIRPANGRPTGQTEDLQSYFSNDVIDDFPDAPAGVDRSSRPGYNMGYSPPPPYTVIPTDGKCDEVDGTPSMAAVMAVLKMSNDIYEGVSPAYTQKQ